MGALRLVVEEALQGFDYEFQVVVPFELVLNLHKILVQHVQSLGEEPADRVTHARRRFKERKRIRDDAERAGFDGANGRCVRGIKQSGHFSEDDSGLTGCGDGYPIPEDLDRPLHEEEEAAGLIALTDNLLPGSNRLELPTVQQFHDV